MDSRNFDQFARKSAPIWPGHAVGHIGPRNGHYFALPFRQRTDFAQTKVDELLIEFLCGLDGCRTLSNPRRAAEVRGQTIVLDIDSHTILPLSLVDFGFVVDFRVDFIRLFFNTPLNTLNVGDALDRAVVLFANENYRNVARGERCAHLS